MAARLQLAQAPCVLDASGAARWPLALLDAALLAWLALEGPTARSRMAQLLWPDKGTEAARNSLRQRLFQLKKRLGVDLVTGSATLALADGVTHDLDDADGVLGDTPAEDIAAAEFARWIEQQRVHRRDRVRRALVELCEMAEGAQDYDDALTHARELLALDALSEDAHRRVIRLQYLRGDRAAALLAFDHCERMLKDDIGAKPSPETLALLATIDATEARGAPPADRQVPACVLRPPRMVGRERELTLLEQGWQAGQVVALIGEAGVGKTRLLLEFGESRPGTVYASGRPGDGGVPFATLARLLRAVMARVDAGALALTTEPTRNELARVLPELDAALPRQAGGGQRLVLQRALIDLLAGCRGLHGLIVDDLHFADEASLEMLAPLVDQSGGGLRWVLAFRPAAVASPVRALHDGLVEQARLMPLPLEPLDAGQLAELIDSLSLPGVQGNALAPGLLRRTGGNPLFVLETLKQAWVDRTMARLADGQLLPRPLTVGRLIEQRVAQLSPGALALARAAAIAGVDFDIAVAEHVLGVSALQFADALNELESAQLMRGPEFAHDLVFEAVHASVPRAIARHLHARIANWLGQHGGEPARVARHWMDAGQDEQALPWLARAAGIARLALRPKECVAFLETQSAIEAAAGDRHAAFESLYAAAQELRSTDCEFQRGLAQCDRLDALACTPEQRVKALLERGLLHSWARESPAVEILSRALRELERSAIDDAALAARVHQGLGVACQQNGHTHDALVHLRAALGWLDHRAGSHERAQAHGDLACVLDNLGRPDEALVHHQIALEQMRAAGDANNLSIACGNLACNRIDTGDLEGADAALAQAHQIIASHDGFEGGLPLVLLLRTLVSCHLGRYGDALEQGGRCVGSTQRSQPALVARARLRLAQCWWHLGQWARLAQALKEVESFKIDEPSAVAMRARLQWAYAREHPTATSGAAAAAVSALRQLRDRLEAEGERPDVCLALRIELAAAEELPTALEALAAVAREARRIGHLGTARAAHLRAAALLTDVDARRSRDEAHAALALAADGRQDTITLPAELWLHAGRALVAAGDAQADEVLLRGRLWVTDTAQRVPEPYRTGFLQRNPVNRELLALAARTILR